MLLAEKTALGIDLGTTNSCMGVFKDGKTQIIPNKEGDLSTPSVVAYTKDGVLVGKAAIRQAALNHKNTIFSIKRIMGLMMHEDKAKEAAKHLPYALESKNGACAVKIEKGLFKSELLMPQEISAQILKKLKDDASAYLGFNVKDAVITVPAYFNDSQRRATKEAGQIAGLNVIRVVNEPTAAALAYGLDKNQSERILVYDLGGGTFDVTVLETGDGVVEVLSTQGDAFLGGDDFDRALVDFLLWGFREQHKIDLSKDAMAMQRIKEAAELAKRELSSNQNSSINVPFIKDKLSLEQSLSRADFERLISPFIDKSIDTVKEAIKSSGLKAKDISQIVLVGGSSRIPLVQLRLEKFFGRSLNKSVNPDEVVALGAIAQGGILKGALANVILLDITPLSLGIELDDGTTSRLIEKGTSIPTKKSDTYTTASNNQRAVKINILQGEKKYVKDNKSLGKFTLEGIRPAPRGVPQIEVIFEIDQDGILTVTAIDKDTGKSQFIRISGSSNLSQNEIASMREQLLLN